MAKKSRAAGAFSGGKHGRKSIGTKSSPQPTKAVTSIAKGKK